MEQLYTILDNLNLITFLITPDFEITYENRKAKEIFGDVVGKKCYEVMHGLTSSPTFCRIIAAQISY